MHPKVSWDVSSKRRRRSSQMQPSSQPALTLSLQPSLVDPPAAPPSAAAPPSPPADPPSPAAAPPADSSDCDANKLSVVEMVAFLEQRLRLHHAVPSPAPSSTLSSLDRPITAQQQQQGEEPAESVSVSDMIAKLESQCLRRRTQGERRAVGRVLLAEQSHAPLANQRPIKPPKATPTPSPGADTRKSSVSVCKSDLKVKVTPCFSTDSKTPAKATPTFSERSDAIGRDKTAPPPSRLPKPVQFCKSDKSAQAKPSAAQKCDSKEAQKSDFLMKTETARITDVVSAKNLKTESKICDKDATKTDPKHVDSLKTVETSSAKLKNTSPSASKTKKSSESSTNEEPLPGLLFLTPPPKPSVQSEQATALSPASLSPNADQSEQRKADSLAGQVKSSFSLSPASSSDSSPIRTLHSTVQSETRKAKSDSNLSRLDLVVQSEARKPSGVQSERSCVSVALLDQTDQSQNSSASSSSQSKKRKSCVELSVQSEARIELLPLESQSQRRRLNRIAQSEKRNSCPVMVSDWSNSQDESQPQETSQSEQRRVFSDQSESRCSVLRSASDVGVGLERRRRRKAARAFSLCSEGAGPEGGASEDFLLMRRRVQSLLEPRSHLSLLSLLPHHLLLHILLHLPTRALAALKCTCRYLRLVIDTYDPRPLDALWVCDPRYPRRPLQTVQTAAPARGRVALPLAPQTLLPGAALRPGILDVLPRRPQGRARLQRGSP
ncbi:hypothetical protein WMY93_016519 [Mugilogobius chulae]|uniref:F-box domain-containing protein n=1 Tax=Mugilogobius chulae TaxID=88201 RepID=A0AAW0NVU5_9GOBI